MSEEARALAHLLLRVGVLDRRDDEHQRLYAELMGAPALFTAVRDRLAEVGYELVQHSGHLGVRVARDAEAFAPTRNHEQLHAGHIRLLVYLWTHLVYREWVDLRHELHSAAPGMEQSSLFEDAEDERPPAIAYRRVFEDFAETMARTNIKSYLRALKRHRFIRVDQRADRIEADSSLYVLVDHHRMEDFVVELARRLTTEDPVEAVHEIATGSPLKTNDAEPDATPAPEEERA